MGHISNITAREIIFLKCSDRLTPMMKGWRIGGEYIFQYRRSQTYLLNQISSLALKIISLVYKRSIILKKNPRFPKRRSANMIPVFSVEPHLTLSA